MSEQTKRSQYLSSADLESMVLKLGSKDKAVCAEAERVVKQVGVEAIEPLVAVLTRELDTHRKRWWMALAGFLTLPLGFILLVPHLRENDYLALFIGFGAYMVGITLLAHSSQPSRLQKQAASMLMGIDDLRGIGPLIDILRTPSTTENAQVRSLLLPMLQRLRASDVALIAERHREHFRYVLKHWEHFQLGPQNGTEYIVAVLTALQQVGDARDLPYVESIAFPDKPPRAAGAGLHWLQKGYTAAFKLLYGGQWRGIDKSRIVRAAQECLPYLQQKAEQERANHSLLRASAPGTDTSDVLLRPATGHDSTEAQSLLRAGAGGVEEVE